MSWGYVNFMRYGKQWESLNKHSLRNVNWFIRGIRKLHLLLIRARVLFTNPITMCLTGLQSEVVFQIIPMGIDHFLNYLPCKCFYIKSAFIRQRVLLFGSLYNNQNWSMRLMWHLKNRLKIPRTDTYVVSDKKVILSLESVASHWKPRAQRFK